MKENKNNKNKIIGTIVIVLVILFVSVKGNSKQRINEVDNQTISTITQSPKDVCEQAKDVVFNYELQDYGDQDLKGKTIFSSKLGTYIKLEKLKDYFLAYGESKTAGGYYSETIKTSDDECKVRVILYDEEKNPEKVNPVWDIKGTKMTCDNSGAFALTSELGFSE